MNLHEIANNGGFGSGRRVIDEQRARDERNSHIPEPMLMAELHAVTGGTTWGAPVASLGHCPDTGKDWAIEHRSDLGMVDGRACTASSDALALVAVWNAFRDGDLVWSDRIKQPPKERNDG